MNDPELHKLVFETADQWESGLYSKLKITEEEGLTLFSRPAFDKWLIQGAHDAQPLCLSIDPCGLIYWIDEQRCQLYTFNQKSGFREHIPCISGCGSGSDEINRPDRLIVDHQTLWLLDRGNQRVLVYAMDLFQLKHIISIEKARLSDIGYDGATYLYVLDNRDKKIIRFDKSGSIIGDPIDLRIDDKKKFNDPFRLLVGVNGTIYVLDRDADMYCLYLFIPDEKRFEKISDFSDMSFCRRPFKPSIIIISKAGSILAAEKGSSVIHEFGPLGGCLGLIQMPGESTGINCMAFDVNDTLYVGTDVGIAKFSLSRNFVGEEGVYYSRTLDKGTEKRSWHRLEFEFARQKLPENTTIEVSYYSSDNLALRHRIDSIVDQGGRSVGRKIDDLEKLLKPYWETEKNVVRAMLFRKSAAGRFLWLKLRLSTFDPARKPSIKSMKVYYPRLSYLRYLPAVYQEDPISRDFLERFLSLFETIFYNLEINIFSLFQYFNPATTIKQFLPWLASWLNMSFEEAWKEQTKRNLIQNAVKLYKKKGTLGGVADFIELVIGQRPIIYEDAEFAEPFVLGGKFYVGDNIVVTKGPARGFRLGDDSILGIAAIRDTPRRPDDPFKSHAHRFTVMLNLTRAKYDQHKLSIKRILDEEKPAYTEYTICLIADTKLGHLTYVGVNTMLTGLKPFCIGISSIPGKTVLNIKGEKGGRLERNSRIGSTLTLM